MSLSYMHFLSLLLETKTVCGVKIFLWTKSMPHLMCIKFSHNSFAYSKHLGSHRLNLKAGAEGRAEPSTLETHSKARTATLVHSPCRGHVSFSKVTGDTLQLEKPFYISNSIFSDWKPDMVCFFGRMISFSFICCIASLPESLISGYTV